jgi:hypothetical protein
MLIAFWSCKQQTPALENEAQADGLDQAMRQEFRMTRDPQTGTIPRERLADAKTYMESLTGQGGRVNNLTWQERGPNNVAGRTRTLLVDKRDASGNTVFAGSVSGGIFKTTNFNSPAPTWSIVNDFLPNLAISVLVQDPVNPDTLFAATGEGWFNYDAVRGAGIYKSTNGGATWSQLASTTGFEYVQDFVIDNNGNFYATLRNLTTTNRGVMRSTNRGQSWTQVLGSPLPGFITGRAADLEVASNGDLYASLGILSRTVVLKSSFAANGANTGAAGTWVDITPPAPSVTQRAEIVIAPSDPQRIYVLLQDSTSSQVLNMYRSVNGGSSWTNLIPPSALNNGANSQTWFNLIGAVDPTNPNILVVGGLNLARSLDGGDNWTTISTSGSVHVDQHALVFTSSSSLLVGNDGGVYHSTNINSGTPTFQVKNTGYNVTQYYACDLHPSQTNFFLAGSQDNGTQRFISAGINTTTNASGGDGGFCHIDQANPQLQITSTTANNFLRSLDGGTSFASLGSGINNTRGQFINPSDLDDVAKVLYAGDDAGKYYCVTNLNGTPASLSVTAPSMGTMELTAVRVDRNTPNTIWVGCSFGSPLVAPRIIKFTNANTSTPIASVSTTISAPAGAAVSSIDIHPTNSNRVLVTLSSYGVQSVWESSDGGGTFTSIEGNLPDMPVRWGLYAPSNAQLSGPSGGNGGILLATELGVWSTSVVNGTSTQWSPNNNGLANVRTDMLRFRSSDNLVVVASHGRGLFTTTLPTVVTGINDPGTTPGFIRYISASPERLLIVPGSLGTRSLSVAIFDMSGKQVYRSQGAYRSLSVSLQGWASGVYTIQCVGSGREYYSGSFLK